MKDALITGGVVFIIVAIGLIALNKFMAGKQQAQE